jgi:hypothetical protein
VIDGHIETNDASITPSEEVRLPDVEIIHQRNNVRGHQAIADLFVREGRPPVATAINGNHLVLPRQSRNLILPVVGIAQSTVKEKQRRALSMDFVIHLDVIDWRLTL